MSTPGGDKRKEGEKGESERCITRCMDGGRGRKEGATNYSVLGEGVGLEALSPGM